MPQSFRNNKKAPRISRLLAGLSATFFTALTSLAALAIQPFTIRDIRVEGVQRTEAGTVFSYLPVKVGEQMNDDKAASALKALYATGFYTDRKSTRLNSSHRP